MQRNSALELLGIATDTYVHSTLAWRLCKSNFPFSGSRLFALGQNSNGVHVVDDERRVFLCGFKFSDSCIVGGSSF